MKKLGAIFCVLSISLTAFAIEDAKSFKVIEAVLFTVKQNENFHYFRHLAKVEVKINRQNLRLTNLAVADFLDDNGMCGSFTFAISESDEGDLSAQQVGGQQKCK